MAATGPVSEYMAGRLTCKRDVIEALKDGESFRVVTPQATFQLTRADVYKAFPGVVRPPLSRSRRLPQSPRLKGSKTISGR